MMGSTKIICNAPLSLGNNDEDVIPLNFWNGESCKQNAELRSCDIHKKFMRHLPERYEDLLEIATYVYCADQALSRGSLRADPHGDLWRRNFEFIIGVRDLDFWNDPEVNDCLCRLLTFLSDDYFSFHFVGLAGQPPKPGYLHFSDDIGLHSQPEQVILFSGGLDSLGGAIQESIVEGRKTVLVRHYSTPKFSTRFKTLEEELKKKCKGNAPLSITVKANKDQDLTAEYTQRTRSFLYASLGTTVASMLGLDNIRFYENGVVSLNLPVCEQVIGGRATRTTHPKVLRGYQELFSLIAGDTFTVENKFIWKTKTEVVKLIVENDCEDLIPYSVSCAHTWQRSNADSHCGTCSQCIDRRFATISAGQEDNDPVDSYAVDIFTDSLAENKDCFDSQDKTMLATYLERATEISQMEMPDFMATFPEISRAFLHLPGNATTNAKKAYRLYKRHADEICEVMDDMVRRYTPEIRKGNLPNDCLVRLVSDAGAFFPVPMTSPEEEPENYFWKRGEPWQFRYNAGTSYLLLPDKGSDYLNILLTRPNTQIPILEITGDLARQKCDTIINGKAPSVDVSNGYQVIDGTELGSINYDEADIEALLSYRNRINELDPLIEEAAQENSAIELKQLEDEKADILREINRIVDKRGKLRTVKDKKKNLQDGVRNAIQRTIEKIGKYDQSFADHLTAQLNYGKAPIYKLENEIQWVTKMPTT